MLVIVALIRIPVICYPGLKGREGVDDSARDLFRVYRFGHTQYELVIRALGGADVVVVFVIVYAVWLNWARKPD